MNLNGVRVYEVALEMGKLQEGKYRYVACSLLRVRRGSRMYPS